MESFHTSHNNPRDKSIYIMATRHPFQQFQQYNAFQQLGGYRNGNIQEEYDSKVRVEVVNDHNIINSDIDTSYETDIISDTIEETSKAHLISKSISAVSNGQYTHSIPIANNINNMSHKLYTQIHNLQEFSLITVEDIRNLIFKKNITEWTKTSIKEFVQELKYYAFEKNEFMKNIHSSQNLQLHDKIPPSIVNPIKQHNEQIDTQQQLQHTSLNSSTIDLHDIESKNYHSKNVRDNSNFEKEQKFEKNIYISNHPKTNEYNLKHVSNSFSKKFEKDKESLHHIHHATNITPDLQHSSFRNPFRNIYSDGQKNTCTLTINSDDRNKILYESQYNFKIIFETPTNSEEEIKGVIYNNFDNVVNIEVLSVMIPKNDENDIENYPYLMLIMPELGTCGIGSNKWLNKSIGKLYFTEKVGNNYMIHTNKINEISKNFNEPINLKSLTIQIRKPNGDIWMKKQTNETGDIEIKEVENDAISHNLPLIIELKITTVKKQIRNNNIMNALN